MLRKEKESYEIKDSEKKKKKWVGSAPWGRQCAFEESGLNRKPTLAGKFLKQMQRRPPNASTK